jgi:catechol 2,3-dioxygenase-like lactoylglutathione lyase family enzyme
MTAPSNAVLSGIHHITAIASDPQANFDFYTKFVGLRFVKKTVNFDDPGSYHFYYGDANGAPGTILTFFPWPGARRGRQGSGQVTLTSFAVPRGAIGSWVTKLSKANIDFEGPVARFGEEVLTFADPDGLKLEVIASLEGDGDAVRCFHSATLSEEGYERTARLLTDVMGFSFVGEERNRFRFAVNGGGASKIVDVLCVPDSARGSISAGTVHHIAWRTPTAEQQLQWRGTLAGLDYNVSPVMDRNYFESIYFREPGGILFEIATDPPGFTVDEPLESLGESLKLPAQYESMRAKIEAALPPVRT